MGAEFPHELIALLSELDGDGRLLMSAKKIAECAADMRELKGIDELYGSAADFVFFAENGCGDYYGYKKKTGENGIFIWEHETGEASLVAENMADLILKYYRSEI